MSHSASTVIRNIVVEVLAKSSHKAKNARNEEPSDQAADTRAEGQAEVSS